MQFGVTVFLGAETIDVRTLARACEDLGFDSLFLPEHTHIPVARASVYEPEGGKDLPPEFLRVLDPFVALAAAASVTTTLMLGTGLCLIAQRDPIILAKEVSTLDQLSGGRVALGVGPGWNREEMRNHHLDPANRHAVMEEAIQALKRIWTDDEAEFHGDFIDFDPIWQWPKPAQDPHPPVYIGGSGPKVLARVVSLGEGWLASTKREDPDLLGDRVAELQSLAARAGRGRIPVILQRADPSPSSVGSYQQAGIDHCTFGLPSGPSDEVVPVLKVLAAVVADFR